MVTNLAMLTKRLGRRASVAAALTVVGILLLQATAVASVKVPAFEQGRGVVLVERPEYLDAPRNLAPGSISQRDGWGRISWESWGGAVANGTATYFWHTPGDIIEYPSTIRLETLKRCGGDKVYTKVVGTFVGSPPPDLPATVTTPVLQFSCGPPSRSASKTARSCGTASVKFAPDGEGAAVKIRANRVSCRTAKRVARACLRGRLSGWRVEPASASDPTHGPRTLMRKGRATISFSLVGGGGCGN